MFTRCRFQNVPVRAPFSKSSFFKICRQKMCRFRVNGRPIRHSFTVFTMCGHHLNVSLFETDFTSISHSLISDKVAIFTRRDIRHFWLISFLADTLHSIRMSGSFSIAEIHHSLLPTAETFAKDGVAELYPHSPGFGVLLFQNFKRA